MSEPVVTTAPIVATGNTEPAKKPYGFTTVPIEVKPVASTAEAPKVEPVVAKPDDTATLASALAKASAGERTAKAAVTAVEAKLADLTTQLEAAKGGSTKAEQLEAEIADMLAHPRKYLAKYKPREDGKAFEEVLAGFAEDEPEGNPRLDALEAKVNDREKAEAEAKRVADEEKKKKDETELTAAQEAANEKGRAFVSNLVKEENEKATSESVARFALIGDDVSAIERARSEVIAYIEKEGLTPDEAQTKELVLQALDQMEENERKELDTKAAKLKRNVPDRNILGVKSFSQQSQHMTGAETRPPTAIANFRSAPLPSPGATANGTPKKAWGWTGGLST